MCRTVAFVLLGTSIGCGAATPPSAAPITSAPVSATAETSDQPSTAGTAAELPPAAGSPTASPPPESTIKALLEKDMWGPPAQGGTQHSYVYKHLKIAPPREGNYLTDGVPPNKTTLVYPVKVAVDISKLYTDGSTAQDSKDQTYVFFLDEFGDWTYRFIQNN